MARIIHRDVQITETDELPVLMRELNSRLKDLTDAVNINRIEAGPGQVLFTTTADGTFPIWIANSDFELVSVTAKISAGTCSLTPKIAGVNVGGVPFTVTTTATTFSISAPNMVTALDSVDVLTASLGGATLNLSLNLRRRT